jgi:succinate dehydrogenase / fumarate reductase cytochrome b subunit
MNILIHFFRSSLGKKYLMAITGLALFLFVIGHMVGNLQIFLGWETINAYAKFLQSKPALLWTARLGLLLMVVVHIVSAVQLARMNRAARGQAYGEYKPVGSTYASRTMLMSGIIVFVFIVYHILHFTLALPQVHLLSPSALLPSGNFHDLKDSLGQHDVYRMMVLGFSNIWVSGFYILGMALLCFHLSHGVSSLFQSLGLKNKRLARFIDPFAIASAAMIFVGNISIPIAVLMGFGK